MHTDDRWLSAETWMLIAEYDLRAAERRVALETRHNQRREALAKILCGRRDVAVRYRQASGIEYRWRLSEEKYAGIDDHNREMMAGTQWAKSPTLTGPLLGGSSPVNKRSTVFPRLSARYVDAVFAKLCEMVLSPDAKSFAIKPTPLPDLMVLQEDDHQVAMDGQPLHKMVPASATPPPMPAPAPGPIGDPAQSAGIPPAPLPPPPQQLQPLTVKDLAQERMAQALHAAKKAETRIYDWMVEGRFAAHTRKMIFDAIRIGVGVLKGPFPQTMRRIGVKREANGAMAVFTKTEVRPAFKRVNPWNFFPDPACGDQPKDGDWCFERQYMSPKQVRALLKQEGYQREALVRVLQEGPRRTKSTTHTPYDESMGEKQYEVWFAYGALTLEDLALFNAELAAEYGKEKELDPTAELHILATLINETIVYVTINPLESGQIPYHTLPYIFREDSWAGESLPERLDVPERILVGATRAMMNNAGVSSGSQIILERTGLRPANGSWEIEPDKFWFLTQDATSEDVRKLFMHVDIPNKTKEIYQVVEYAFRLAEESSNLPLITQGFAGKASPDTYGATAIQNSNAAQMLREIAHNLDHEIMEPAALQCYEWLLLDPDVPAEEKGDATVQAHGSTAMVERALQDQFLFQVFPHVVANPLAFKADPEKFFVEMLKAKGLDPRAYQMDDAKYAKLTEQQPTPPQVQAAQIRVQGELQKEQLRLQQQGQLSQAQIQSALQMAQMDLEVEMAKLSLASAVNEAEAQQAIAELELKRQIFAERYANERGLNLENAKKELAMTAQKLKLQRELALLKTGTEVLKPPTEPPGKAGNSEGYAA